MSFFESGTILMMVTVTSPALTSHRCECGLLIRLLVAIASFATCFASNSTAQESLGVQVPDDFIVTQYAGDELAHDIFSMTIDSLGRVVVSGPGYVKILIDADRDGVAESTKTYIGNLPQGVQGMYFLGRDLICASGAGLVRYRDQNGDDQADGPPEVFLHIKTGNEHDLHAIRKGADGWWYLVAGNGSGITSHYAAMPSSPVKNPHAGVVLRLKPDLSQGEVFAHGIRNAYDFDFSTDGELYTYDSDGELVTSLPWYRPTRFLHVLPGSHQGWVTNDWIRPDNFIDMPPVAVSMGRGSPTGVATYRHTAFPAEYHGAMFALDWTYGRVHALKLQKNGSTWSATPTEFMTAVGQHGFAPTDIEVGPEGELYVCVGGRGTRGGVYCIRPKVKNPESKPWPGGSGIPNSVADKLNLCLQAPQPLSSWSRRVWEPIAMEIRSEPFIKAALDSNRTTAERIRAIEILTDKFRGIDVDLVQQLQSATDPAIRARAAWALGRSQPEFPNPSALSAYLQDSDPVVVRTAVEALSGASSDAIAEQIEALGNLLPNRDRYIRQSLMRVMSRTSSGNIHKMAQIGFVKGWSAAIPVAGANVFRTENFTGYAVDVGTSILQGNYDPELKLEAARIIQLGLGDLTPPAGKQTPVYDGYAPRLDLAPHASAVTKLQNSLIAVYPTNLPEVDFEIERLIAMVQPANSGLLNKILSKISPTSDPIDDIHRLIVVSRLPVKPTADQQGVIATTIIQLDAKIEARKYKQDGSWIDRVLEMYDGLVANDPQLPVAILNHPEFGRTGHIQFIGDLPRPQLEQASAKFAQLIAADPEFRWTPDVVFLLATSSSPEYKQLVRSKFDDFSLRGAVLTTLVADPQEADRPLYVASLETGSPDMMLMSIGALQLLGPSTAPMENVLYCRAIRKLGASAEERQARDQLVELLRRNLQLRDSYVLGREGDPQAQAILGISNAVQTAFPKEFAAASGEEAGSEAEMRRLLSSVQWEFGNPVRGEKLFQTRGCIQCHGQGKAIGPALDGVTGRFSREDLFTAIYFPSRDVSPRYQTTQIATHDGKVFSGMLLFEAVDSIALRDANNNTIRVDIEDIESRRLSTQSLMPSGLMKGMTEQDLADFYAYLQTIGTRSTAAAGGR
ncbi:PVC-type heme-binding CxxCH protein [Planctomicrobium sp. SH668]|uniref:PVC-type heme-binding CxxCH protein n=1 Tax=Planctomicrobium sp. SH668 TaxID=3448126 RepID=UPI003F5B0BC4